MHGCRHMRITKTLSLSSSSSRRLAYLEHVSTGILIGRHHQIHSFIYAGRFSAESDLTASRLTTLLHTQCGHQSTTELYFTSQPHHCLSLSVCSVLGSIRLPASIDIQDLYFAILIYKLAQQSQSYV